MLQYKNTLEQFLVALNSKARFVYEIDEDVLHANVSSIKVMAWRIWQRQSERLPVPGSFQSLTGRRSK